MQVNDLKSMVFWITSRLKAKREQVDEELLVIQLFASNDARDLSQYIKYRIKGFDDYLYAKEKNGNLKHVSI
jgi:hypothetical protein